ncbi:hypothetical protein BJ878DRAFT_90290 [Calycina marina]|uniref:Nucleoporin Pom152 n=1 Tax=Calycina marina TaxID=1763456 RepID=A0A9P7ZCH1_9HELO|nr:hypothetical protein BJ878DRAFT_90290 [Calycina marina]
MNGTPRLRSAYPSTPGSVRRTAATPPSSGNGPVARPPLPPVPLAPANASSPDSLIPEHLVSYPTQRLWATLAYSFLLVWCLFDWWKLVEAEATSMGLFLKWLSIFAIYCYGLPILQIPWLEWSSAMASTAFIVHGILVAMLMFRVPLPIEGWLLFFTKTLFDREMSVSENSVRPASILQNSSLIMGRQIINILPEGSATMNPGGLSFCIGNNHPSVQIPIRFNQTSPIHIELLRFDFDTNSNESIILTSRERKKRYEDKEHHIATVSYTAKKPGLYRLHKIVDETKLEVQRRMSDTLVVRCPEVKVSAPETDKCIGDLSDLTMEIEGTAPLKIVYTRTTQKEESTHHFQSIQPENFASPLLGSTRANTLVVPGSPDFSWARSQVIKVPLNESMTPGGTWTYSIDEIHDAVGNVANFSIKGEDGEHLYPKGHNLEHSFAVHERPVAHFTGCDSRNPLKVANGKYTKLPIRYSYAGPGPDDTSHTLSLKFSPIDTLTASGDHGETVSFTEFDAKSAGQTPQINHPGLYTLVGVKSKYCDGEVREPASCLLLNPPEPSLSITSENINDKCAGNSIGLLLDLDMIGTPPFVVRYDVITKSGVRQERVEVDGLRHQLELKPKHAGHFKYRFTSIDDAVYKGHRLTGDSLVLEQDVRPPASASLRKPSGPIDACIEEPVEIKVELTGEKPFTLEYELVYGGSRKKFKVKDIDSDVYKIQTSSLDRGGEYSLALASVTDKTGCKIFLNSEVKFAVRHQRPRVSFGHLDGKYRTVEIEGRRISLPLRLNGRAPWELKYRNIDDTSGKIMTQTLKSTNDFIKVGSSGTYELLEVSDDQCPGTVDPKASNFEVEWLPRPQIKVADTAVLIPSGDRYVKRDVCEGDVDAVEVSLVGSSPYHVGYRITHKPSGTIHPKEFDAALGLATISMDTSKAGTYEYRFSELSDSLYEHDSKTFTPLILEQKVNRKPSAVFTKPGQSYKYCKEEISGDEVIPIKLEGLPPFSLEVDIKHQNSARPETVKIANVEFNHYDFRIPHRVLSLGVHQVSVRKVRDANGCQQKTNYDGPKVQVQVYDVPTIYPQETRTDYCIGERIAYTLSGQAPFEIFYDFEGVQRKAKSQTTNFRRIAEKPGTFTITAVSDKASNCKASTAITKIIHEMPSVKISKGRQVEVDIHEGGEAQILFEFWGTPPFEFTYTRSTNARKGQKSRVLETRHEVSEEHSMVIQSSQEGTYEVVSIKDKFCSFSTMVSGGEKGQKLLQF